MKYAASFLLISLLWSVSAQAQDDAWLSDREAERLFWEYLKTYSPDSYVLMQDHEQLPTEFRSAGSVVRLGNGQDKWTWVADKSPMGIREDIGTVVHETNHGYTTRKAYALLAENNQLEWGVDYSAFYIAEGQILVVKHQEVLNSHKIARLIPKELRTFRYRPYLSPANPLLGAQKEGIYGLMDEWNSYFHGTRTHLDMYDYYASLDRKGGAHYQEWIQQIASVQVAYLEFKYFILQYLMYVQAEDRQMYQALLNQRELMQAFFTIDEEYGQVVQGYYDKKAQLLELFLSQGLRAEDDGEYFWVNGNGVGTYEQDYRQLEQELAKPEYQEMLHAMRRALS